MNQISSPKVHCPKCGSDQITADKKGFSGTKAVAGALVTGGIGILAGTIGSNKIQVHCLNCGNSWLPSEHSKQATKYSEDKLVQDRLSLIRLYKSGSIESAKSAYRRIHDLANDAEVSNENLKTYYDSAAQGVNNSYFALLILVIVIIIVIVLFIRR